LKAVLKPDDYQTIEEAEKQRELERKILLGQIDDPAIIASVNLKKKTT